MQTISKFLLIIPCCILYATTPVDILFVSEGNIAGFGKP
jgi:hypothetical protein